jgi:hypothetical protein
VLRPLRPLWTLGIARTRADRLRVVTWRAIVVPVLGTRAATARRSLTGRMLALAAGNAALRRVAGSMMWLRSAFRVGARGGSGVTLPLRPALAVRAPGAALVRRS